MPDKPQTPAIASDEAKSFAAPEDELQEFLTEMRGKISDDTTTRQFAFQRAKNNYQMYRGMIGRPLSDLPFEGSSDIRYRLSTLYIRQTRAGFTNVVLGAPKLVRYQPAFNTTASDYKKVNDAADRHEAFSQTLYKELVKDFHNIVDYTFSKLAIDGRAVLKVIWSTETGLATETRERQTFVDLLLQAQIGKYKGFMAAFGKNGKQPTPKQLENADLTDEDSRKIIAQYLGWDEETDRFKERLDSVMKQIDTEDEFIELIVDRVVTNGPALAVVNYEDLIVPDDTTRIADAEWVAHKLRFSKRALRSKSLKNGGPYRGVEELLEDEFMAPRDVEQRQMDSARRKAEGLQQVGEKKDYLNCVELYCWVKRSWIKRFKKQTMTGPDMEVRAVITFAGETKPERPPVVLRAIELPYHHGQWPFVDFFYNQTDKRFYENEGIVGLLWPVELEHNIARNAAINRSSIAMSPPGFYMEECGFEPSTHRQLGHMHPIDDAAFIASQGMPARFLEYPQALTSLPDYDANNARSWAADIVGVPNMANLAGYATAPTQEQVQQAVTPANMIQQHEVANWLERWGRVFWMVHELCKQYLFLDGSKEKGFVNPENNQANKLTALDYEFKFIVTAGGDPSMESPVLLAQKRALVMQQYVQNPALAPFGDLYEAWHSYVHHTLPYNESAAFVPPREKAEEVNQKFLQMAAENLAKLQAGKRPQRNQKQLQLSNAFSNIRPR